MTPASEQELANSMIRMWGNRAGALARNYAVDCRRRGDHAGSSRWHSVERIVDRVQVVSEVGRLYPNPAPRLIPRRRSWFEALIATVLPAIHKLGSATIRGTGM
jgi:hypothetical protein